MGTPPKNHDNLIEEPAGFRKIEIVTTDGEHKVLLKGQPCMSWRSEDQVAKTSGDIVLKQKQWSSKSGKVNPAILAVGIIY